MKKILVLTLVITLVMALSACDFPIEAQLGTTEFSLILPAGYAMAEDEMDEDQVAYFYKDDESIDFDVYQWEKGDEYTLEGEAEYFAAQYGTVAERININGFDAMKYISTEEYDGHTYTVVNYMFEDETYIIELCFWTVGTEAEYAAVDEIINTLGLMVH